MKGIKFLSIGIIAFVGGMFLVSFLNGTRLPIKKFAFPYKQAGLTDRQAAAHLLNRFTFGATPGQVDSVVKMGLENWFNHQLNADFAEDSLDKRLKNYDALNYTNKQVADIFPNRFYVYDQAAKDGCISRDSIYFAKDKKAFNAQIKAYMADKGYRTEGELYSQFIDQKVLRAVYSNNQLQEVLTDFWFNHFNVSFSKNGPGRFIPAYERDVIRPNVFGKFDQLVLATAKSPAMLMYLDNYISVAPPVVVPEKKVVEPIADPNTMMMGMMGDTLHKIPVVKKAPRKNVSGLNENYAREVMELHILGVDGGYTQKDVTQAARVLTGWTVYPQNGQSYNSGLLKQYLKTGDAALTQQGYVHEGDFVFIPTRHDKGEKTILGHHFGANGGYDEGLTLLEMLAHHPSAAKFITRKLAVRFVCDNPPVSLLNKMSKSFTEHDGDIKQVLITMVTSPEFWSVKMLREKTKSPFELAISSVRSLNADVKQPVQLYNWASKMGQRVYYYLAPTGYPDRGTYWINTGSLLNRMNFGLELAAQRIPGVKFNLVALNSGNEPVDAQQALEVYGKLIMPERNMAQSIKTLTPLLNNPDLLAKVSNAANNKPVLSQVSIASGAMEVIKPKATDQLFYTAQSKKGSTNPMLAQVVGIIIGSPEYQRR